MTAATRQKALRDRRKAGLALVSVWVPQDKLDEFNAAIAAILKDNETDKETP